jgi:hypothetical protein
MRLEAGDSDAAVADLQMVLTDPGATQALQGRARQLIIAAGGELPLPPTAPPAASRGAPAGADGAPGPADG